MIKDFPLPTERLAAGRFRAESPGSVGSAGRYAVEGELASGGMGVVYRVRDRSTGAQLALKRLQGKAAAKPHLVESFKREYQVLAGLEHPRIIRVYDCGIDELGPYYTMELVEGQDMRAAAPLGYEQACFYLRDVATSLALLHARRLIHRDLSPGNVRVADDGHCKLLDFGALTSFGPSRYVVGTPPGIPPEAMSGAPLDQRADLYSLGALAYWLLTRRHAYPARGIDELPDAWKLAPAPPSHWNPEIPEAMDALVMALLNPDPLARPTSAAAVIARLDSIGRLAPENDRETQRLAQSYLLRPAFVGRRRELRNLEPRTRLLGDGRGGAICIQAAPGMGRTRLLEETGVRAQLAGACVVRVDASVDREHGGTSAALAHQLLEALPQLARQRARPFLRALTAICPEIAAEGAPGSETAPNGSGAFESLRETQTPLEDWIAETSRDKPLLVAVDNIEYADDASLGLLVTLAKRATDHPILLVVTEGKRPDALGSIGLAALLSYCDRVEVGGLDASETLDLARSLFGDAPNVERFAGWLHDHTAGSPLHCIEISRQLVARRIIHYFDGLWVLPQDLPDVAVSSDLEQMLSSRIAGLSEAARALAECLSLQRGQPSFALCELLSDLEEAAAVPRLLDELALADVLHGDGETYRFSSVALREALLRAMDEPRLEANHRRLGEALAQLAGTDDPALSIEAGWQLIQGGEELRGADMIAAVADHATTVRTLIANLHHVGKQLEAALQVYKRHRRSMYERAPLLCALAHAGYYENRQWGERYGDEALDACEDLCGLRTARILRPWMGKLPSFAIAITAAILRFYLAPGRTRTYSFRTLMVQLFGAVTTLTGTAALSLDVTRAARVADTLEPFSWLPARATPVGIYEFCRALQEIGRDNQAEAYARFERMLHRFNDPKFYPTLPQDARLLYVAGAHFARGSFAVFRADTDAALQSADALDASGLKLYAMIASQLRFLYYMNRGDFAQAALHREQVEMHAAHVGSAWQVETWEAASLLPLYGVMQDVVELKRIASRLAVLSRHVPSLKLYAQLARLALESAHQSSPLDSARRAHALVAAHPPRSFIGWSTTVALAAESFNELGDHAVARDVCRRALAIMTEADRAYPMLYTNVETAAARADAGLGDFEAATRRVDALIERFRDAEHPIVRGSLYEARARIAKMGGDTSTYEESLAEVARCFRATGTPALIAKYERLAGLHGEGRSGRPSRIEATTTQSLKADTDAVTITDDRERDDAPTSIERVRS